MPTLYEAHFDNNGNIFLYVYIHVQKSFEPIANKTYVISLFP